VQHIESLSDDLSDISVRTDSTIDLIVRLYDMTDHYLETADEPFAGPPSNEGAANNNPDQADAHPNGLPAAGDVAGQHNNGSPLTHAPGAAVNAITDGAIDGPQPSAATRPAHAVTAPAAAAYTTNGASNGSGSGITPGDSELMPPRFTGDGKVDAHQWAKQFRNYLRNAYATGHTGIRRTAAHESPHRYSGPVAGRPAGGPSY